MSVSSSVTWTAMERLQIDDLGSGAQLECAQTIGVREKR